MLSKSQFGVVTPSVSNAPVAPHGLLDFLLLLELTLTDVRYPCYTRRNIAFFNLFIILSCNCTNCSAIMVAILDCTGQAALPMSKRVFMPLERLYAPIL